jgi:hypothetical protein
MSSHDAAEYYLATVCPANAANAAYYAAQTPSETLRALQSTAGSAAAAYTVAAKRLDDPTLVWPSDVDVADVARVRDTYLSWTNSLNSVRHAATLTDAAEITFDPGTDGAGAAQHIRLRLGLPSDGAASCAGR